MTKIVAREITTEILYYMLILERTWIAKHGMEGV